MPLAATWMDPETVILSEASQRKTNIIWCHLYVESEKIIQMNYLQKETENKLVVTEKDSEASGGKR